MSLRRCPEEVLIHIALWGAKREEIGVLGVVGNA